MSWYPEYDTTVYDERKRPAGGPKLPVASNKLPGADPTKWDEDGNPIRQPQFSLKKPAPLAETYKFTPTPRRERKLMAGTDKRKQSLYFPDEMLRQIEAEADRQDRSLSWIVQKAWQLAFPQLQKFPGMKDFPGAEGV